MNRYILYIFVITAIALAFSCSKEEGFGGNAAIHGVVNLEHYNHDFSILHNTQPAANTYVYLIFGDQPGFGDRVRTSFDGSFQFTNLTGGDYTVYTYSMDSSVTAVSENLIVQKEISISERKQIVDAGSINIMDNKALGRATIRGKVKEIDTVNFGIEYYIGNKSVYLVYGSEVNYSDSQRTNHEGEFEFADLHKGIYHIYTYSKDVTGSHPGPEYAEMVTVEINDQYQEIVLDDLITYK